MILKSSNFEVVLTGGLKDHPLITGEVKPNKGTPKRVRHFVVPGSSRVCFHKVEVLTEEEEHLTSEVQTCTSLTVTHGRSNGWLCAKHDAEVFPRPVQRSFTPEIDAIFIAEQDRLQIAKDRALGKSFMGLSLFDPLMKG